MGLVFLTGCSSQAPPTPPAASASSSGAQLPAPIIVEPGTGAVEATVGETIVFNQADPAQTQVSTDRPDVLELTQGSDDGSAQFNPGALAVAPGVAVVTIEAADGGTQTVTVTVR